MVMRNETNQSIYEKHDDLTHVNDNDQQSKEQPRCSHGHSICILVDACEALDFITDSKDNNNLESLKTLILDQIFFSQPLHENQIESHFRCGFYLPFS
jgi:hypothetical protein